MGLFVDTVMDGWASIGGAQWRKAMSSAAERTSVLADKDQKETAVAKKEKEDKEGGVLVSSHWGISIFAPRSVNSLPKCMSREVVINTKYKYRSHEEQCQGEHKILKYYNLILTKSKLILKKEKRKILVFKIWLTKLNLN